MSSAANRVSLDTDTVLLRNIYAFNPSTNIPAASNQVLTTGPEGAATFQNPLVPLQSALAATDTQFNTNGWLPSTFSSIYGQLNGLVAPVTQEQFTDLSSNVSTIKTSLQTSIDTISSNLETLSTATAQRFADFSTISGTALIITTLDSHISTLSTNIYTDLSALSTGIRAYIGTNPIGALLSTTFSTFSAKTVADISALSTRLTSNSTAMTGLTNYVDNRFSTLSGLVNFFYTSHVSVTFCTFSSLVFSVMNTLSTNTFSTISGTQDYIYQNPRFDVNGQFSGSLAVNTPLSVITPVGTAFAVNSGNAMTILNVSGGGYVGIKTLAPQTDLDVSGTVKAPVIMARVTTVVGLLPAAVLTTTANAAQLRTGLADSSANLTSAGSLQVTNASGSFVAFTVDVSASKTTINTAADISGKARFYYDTVLQSHANATPTMYIDNSAAKVYVGSSIRTDLSVNTVFNVSGDSYLPNIFINPNPTNQTVYVRSNDGTQAGLSANHYAIFGWGNAFVDEMPRYLSFRAGGDRNVLVLDDTGAVGINKETTYADISNYKLALDVSGTARISQGLYSSTARFDLITSKQQGLYVDASTNVGYITIAGRDFSANGVLPIFCDSSFSISHGLAIGQRGTTSYILDVSGLSRFRGPSTIVDGYLGIGGITTPGKQLDVSGDVRITGTLEADNFQVNTITATQATNIQNNLTVSGGNISGSGSLTIGGTTLLNSTLTVLGDISGLSRLFITGTTQLNTLTVSGDISGLSGLTIKGSTTLNDTLTVSGDISGLAGLTIMGSTTLNNLSVSGDISANGQLYIGTRGSTANTILFAGTYGDTPIVNNSDSSDTLFTTAITERIYSGAEKSELLIFKGNESSGTGYDRIRLAACGGISLQVAPGNSYYSKNNNNIYNTTLLSYLNDASLNTAIHINNSGRVGVGGITSPTTALDISGDTKISGTLTIGSTVIQPSYTVPQGGIIMWSGSSIPSGWALCDGSNGTPDLRGRFIIGATRNSIGNDYNSSKGSADMGKDERGSALGLYNTGVSGGEIKHVLTIEEMPSHNHSFTLNVADSGGSSVLDDAGGSGTKSYNTDNRGNNQPHNNIPPFYALAFIMKL